MKNRDVTQRFNEIKDKFKRGDAVRLSEMSRKSVEICSHIIKGRRNPQPWFMDVAEVYLKVLGRI